MRHESRIGARSQISIHDLIYIYIYHPALSSTITMVTILNTSQNSIDHLNYNLSAVVKTHEVRFKQKQDRNTSQIKSSVVEYIHMGQLS